MAVEVYFREQIANILNAVNMASGGTANLVGAEMIRCSPVRYVVQEDGSLNNQDDMEDLADHLRLYRQGYRDAIVAVAAAFGMPAGRVAPEEAIPAQVVYEQPANRRRATYRTPAFDKA